MNQVLSNPVFFASILSIFFASVVVFDVWKYIIPNWVNGIILFLYPVFVFFAPNHIPWDIGIYSLLGMFAGGILLYKFSIMGGGDVKYLAVCALWTGFPSVLSLLIITALMGAVLSISLMLVRPVIFNFAAKSGKLENLPRIFRKGEPVPYGVAISIAMLILVWMGDVPGLDSVDVTANVL